MKQDPRSPNSNTAMKKPKPFHKPNAKKKGDMVRSPLGDGVMVELRAITTVGVAFKHPTLNACGNRFDGMPVEMKNYLQGDKS